MHELKKGKKKNPPHPLIRRNPKKQTTTKRGRARGLKKFLKIFPDKNAEILDWIIEGHNASDGYDRGKNLPLLLEAAIGA